MDCYIGAILWINFICEPNLTKLGSVFSNVTFEAEKDMQLLQFYNEVKINGA